MALPALALSACAPSDDLTADGSEAEVDSQDNDVVGSSGYTQTLYPIVLCHGMAGFKDVFGGSVAYFYGIESDLASSGAKVYITQVPPFAPTEVRGEALLKQVEDIVALTGAKKVNLIGHSQGGLDARYVAAVRPDLVASITTVGTPHKGAELATFIQKHLKDGSFPLTVLGKAADTLGTLLNLFSGYTSAQDAIGGLNSLSADGTAAFNAKYPAGLPTTQCGQGATSKQGMFFYSWTGSSPTTNSLDVTDPAFKLTSQVYSEVSDGVVGKCSSHFGTVIRDDYKMNHLDEVNQQLGLVASFATNPKTTYRVHANRLKLNGL